MNDILTQNSSFSSHSYNLQHFLVICLNYIFWVFMYFLYFWWNSVIWICFSLHAYTCIHSYTHTYTYMHFLKIIFLRSNIFVLVWHSPPQESSSSRLNPTVSHCLIKVLAISGTSLPYRSFCPIHVFWPTGCLGLCDSVLP